MSESRTQLNSENPDYDRSLIELVEILESIDENKPTAELDQTSMLDREGSRILF